MLLVDWFVGCCGLSDEVDGSSWSSSSPGVTLKVSATAVVISFRSFLTASRTDADCGEK